MAHSGIEPTFSMGVDTPLAVLSRQPRLLSDYFKQRFAQVTNPPIDPIREDSVMCIGAGLGPERNILAESPEQCRVFNIDNPVLLPGELPQIADQTPFKTEHLDCTWPQAERDSGVNSNGASGMKAGLRALVQEAQLAIECQTSVLILSDRNVSPERVAIPMLLAVGAIHHSLCKSGHRMMASLIAETSDVATRISWPCCSDTVARRSIRIWGTRRSLSC